MTRPPRASTPAEGAVTHERGRRALEARGERSPAVVPAAPPAPAPAPSGAFANCSEARAAGAAPVYRGDPGYGSHLDRDDDGVGCE